MPDASLEGLEKYLLFLTEEGYRINAVAPGLIRFESPRASVDLAFDATRGGELGLWLGSVRLSAERCQPFSIGEVLRLRNAGNAKRFALIQVTSQDALERWVQQLADALKNHGGKLLSGDDREFDALLALRRRESAAYAASNRLRDARSEAAAAWGKKDYRAVRDALSPFRASLTPAEIKKIEYAERELEREN